MAPDAANVGGGGTRTRREATWPAVTISSEQDGGGGESDEAADLGEGLVAAGGDAADLLEPVEEALDAVDDHASDCLNTPSTAMH